jgi:hypothetical protein
VKPRPERLHFEPFVHLADVDDDQALIGWGGFWFTPHDDGRGWRIVDDEELGSIEPGREGSIGASSTSFGDALVRVHTAAGELAGEARTNDSNHVWLKGLRPDTEYTYEVLVNGRRWDPDECLSWHRLDDERGELRPSGRRYDLRFRTFPRPDDDSVTSLTFACIGDYGVGIEAGDGRGERQQQVAAALTRLVEDDTVRIVLTLGDNIYLGDADDGSGDEDDDWYFGYYEPYRFVISRVPVYPTVGNHDDAETEQSDDRDQLADNHYTDLRFSKSVEADRDAVGTTTDETPGLFYRFSCGRLAEFCSIDTSHADDPDAPRYFDDEGHRDFLDETFTTDRDDRPLWLLPFMHHPVFCAGPKHDNDAALMRSMVPRFRSGGVRLVLAGHEHNFQHSAAEGITYIVSGAAGKLRAEPPQKFTDARTLGWAAEPHLLLVELTSARATLWPVRSVAEDGSLTCIAVVAPDGSAASAPIVVDR